MNSENKETTKMNEQVDLTYVQSAMAFERTQMANTRTLLAYIRSAVGVFVAGAGLLKFLSEILWVYIVGVVFIVATPMLLGFGLWEYMAVRKRLKKHQKVDGRMLDMEDDEEI